MKLLSYRGQLYRRANLTAWDAAARSSLDKLVDLWLDDGSTKELLQGLSRKMPEEEFVDTMQEKFGVYVADLARAYVDWFQKAKQLRQGKNQGQNQ